MKKTAVIIVLLCFTSILAWSQKKNNSSIPLIGTEAHSFKAESTNGTVNFPDDYCKNWKASLETIHYEGRAPQKINFPLVSDEHYKISEKYGMFHYPTSTPKDIRGVFIIDPENIVQAVYFYPNSIGRNMDEFVRTVQALQTVQNNVVIPANWEPGDDVMLTHLNEHDKIEKEKASNSSIYEVSFYMAFRKMP